MSSKKVEQTAAPLRNFTLTTAERVNAIVTGVPAWARRLKRIEDLSEEIATSERPRYELEQKLVVLHELIDAHNKYYPIEANLPLDPTGRMIDRGKPWTRMAKPTLEALVAKRRALSTDGGVGGEAPDREKLRGQ